MTVAEDRAFYLHRYEQERMAAQATTAHFARIAHLELALRYALLAQQSAATERETPMIIAVSCNKPRV
jgi:hypothetical protein